MPFIFILRFLWRRAFVLGAALFVLSSLAGHSDPLPARGPHGGLSFAIAQDLSSGRAVDVMGTAELHLGLAEDGADASLRAGLTGMAQWGRVAAGASLDLQALPGTGGLATASVRSRIALGRGLSTEVLFGESHGSAYGDKGYITHKALGLDWEDGQGAGLSLGLAKDTINQMAGDRDYYLAELGWHRPMGNGQVHVGLGVVHDDLADRRDGMVRLGYSFGAQGPFRLRAGFTPQMSLRAGGVPAGQ